MRKLAIAIGLLLLLPHFALAASCTGAGLNVLDAVRTTQCIGTVSDANSAQYYGFFLADPTTPTQRAGVSGGALNVNIVSGGASGGTSSSFGAAFPATGTAAGMSQGGNLIALSGTGGNLNVNLAGNSFGTLTIGGTVTANQGGAPWANNITQFGGNAVVTGIGASGLGIPRVSLSNDSVLAANQSVNLSQVGGSSTATAAAGIAKVGLTDGTGNALTSTGSALDINLKTSAATVNVGTHTVTVFQDAPGTNGFTQAPFSVLTTELNALASAGVATSSVNGTSGKFNQTNTGNDIIGRCWMTLGAALGGTAAAGANFSIWFLTSTDGGTTFESQTVSPPPRSPDIIIPVGASNYGASAVLMSPPRQYLWSETVKVVMQNNTGQAMGASGNVLTCAGESTQY